MTASRFVVGIDLGTTNSALAYADTGVAEGKDIALQVVSIPQIVHAGQVEPRTLLPSFLYLPGQNELPAGSLKLPWAADRDHSVGEFARNHGSQVPTRLVSSAKSWLCHSGIDRRGQVLPEKAPEGSRRVSPVEATTLYLKHLCEAWNQQLAKDVPGNRLEQQDVILTVPASFDAAARELTVEAARAAGLENITLLEEPQAAFYSWLQGSGDRWRKQVEVGDVVLICDLGGGTTDLTLIAVGEEAGNLALTRVAVGDHILLGGDNMDLALAHTAAQAFAAKGTKLDFGQMLMLRHSCRAAKEKLFSDTSLASAPVTVLGRGRSVMGGTLKTELTRADVERLLIEGFLPDCPADAAPKQQRTVGLQELGLPYAADTAVSRHLAHFLHRQADEIAARTKLRRGKKGGSTQPTALLFNGGVFKAGPLRDRVVQVVNNWCQKAKTTPVRVLEGADLDLAVARGAAYYGLVRRGKGVRIRGGAARSYYVGVETSLPAVPGMPPPIKALCVVPFGMEEGTESDVKGQEFGLVVGVPAEFRFLGSTVRRGDAVGTLIEDWEDQIDELDPIATTLEAKGMEGKTVPVHLHSRVTEVGTLELSCLSRDGKQKWKLEFNVRERPE